MLFILFIKIVDSFKLNSASIFFDKHNEALVINLI